jgi:archaellum component FlaG (FlaF/FlaG flagellin family)
VKVSEPCVKAFDRLEPGASQKFDCTTTAPQDDVVSTAKATAKAPIGPPVTAEDAAEIDVIHPAVKITKDATPSTVRAGDEVTFTISVTNTGDVPLTSVSVVDDEPCAKKLATLGAGEKRIYTCTGKAPDDDFGATAEVTGMDPGNRSVQSKAEVKVDVVHPQIALMKDAAPYEVRPGDVVTFSILVKNTGDVPLTAVSVVDDHTASCAHTAPALAADAEITYTCTTIAGKNGFTGKATVTAQDPTARPVTASGDATFEVRSG